MLDTAITTILDVDNVSQIFATGSGETRAPVLSDVSMRLKTGEIVALLGRSGSGKSTLLRLIAGLTRPTQGTVKIDGEPVDGPAKEVAMVFQSFALFPWLDVLDIVEDVEPGEKREALKHHRDFLGRSVHRLAVDLHRALRRSRETGDEPQKSRLAGSRAAEQRNDLAGLQAHGNVAQHRRARFSRTCRENLAYLVDVQDRRDGGVQHGLKLPINDAVRDAAAAPR